MSAPGTSSLLTVPKRVNRGVDLCLDPIVHSLRDIRERAHHEWDHPHGQRLLPSARVLRDVVDGLRVALYPQRLGQVESFYHGDGSLHAATDYYVGHTLGVSLRQLHDQIRIELAVRRRIDCTGQNGEDSDHRASVIVAHFAEQLPSIRSLLDLDLQAAFHGDPAASSVEEVLVCYPGMKAITCHRFAHALHCLGAPMVARVIAEISHSDTGVDIHPGAVIGENFFIDHGSGVVIGGTAVIGTGVRLYQAVTLGAKHFPLDENGHAVKGKPRHPIVEDDVVIYSGATILGRVTIGKGSTIGGNVWLTRSVPPGSTITQARARQETFTEGGGI